MINTTQSLTVWAENVMTWYKFTPSSCIVQLHFDYDDYPDRHWWERKYIFTYDYYISKPKEGDYTVLATYWDIKGKVMGCSTCAQRKLWYVKERIPYPNNGAELPRKDLPSLVQLTLRELTPVLPQDVMDEWNKKLAAYVTVGIQPREV